MEQTGGPTGKTRNAAYQNGRIITSLFTIDNILETTMHKKQKKRNRKQCIVQTSANNITVFYSWQRSKLCERGLYA